WTLARGRSRHSAWRRDEARPLQFGSVTDDDATRRDEPMVGLEHTLTRLPDNGLSADQVTDALHHRQADDVDWRNGRMWSLVYSAGEEHDAVIQDAYREFSSVNLLGPTA